MESVIPLTLPMFIGTLLNWALFGALLVQVYIYFSIFRRVDRASLQLIVILVVSLEVVETLSSTHDMILVFGTGWGNKDTLDSVGWAWFSVPVMGSIIAFVCQVFYGWRIYMIGKSPSAFALITLVSLVQLGAGIWTGVEICKAGRFSLLQSENLPATATWLATTSLADLLIVCGTAFFLRRGRPDPEFTSKKTNSIISRIIMITAQTGTLCMLFALVDLFLFVKYKGTNYHLSVCIELSKIYSNSILLIFNSRAHMGYGCHLTTSNTSYSVNLSSTAFRTRSSAPIETGVSVSSAESDDYSARKMQMEV
ncbi:hypothetical protein C8R45DRAFT_79712 [Mycena sanguinolenta]|nr:hypothetical protein C8R45DRAFT_79712 [Mycena sanguinolenta]